MNSAVMIAFPFPWNASSSSSPDVAPFENPRLEETWPTAVFQSNRDVGNVGELSTSRLQMAALFSSVTKPCLPDWPPAGPRAAGNSNRMTTVRTARIPRRGGADSRAHAATLVTPLLFFFLSALLARAEGDAFVIGVGGFNRSSNVRCSPGVGSSGVLQMSPSADAAPNVYAGRCLHNGAVRLRDAGGDVSSFGTTFTFAMYDADPGGGGKDMGFAFILVGDASPERGYATTAEAAPYLGLLNASSSGPNSSHSFLAVEFDVHDPRKRGEFGGGDPPYDHVGVDLNSVNSTFTARAGENGPGIDCGNGAAVEAAAADLAAGDEKFSAMNLSDGRLIQAWIEYDGPGRELRVTMSSRPGTRPARPLIRANVDLGSIVESAMHVGFSCAGSADGEKTPTVIYAWSFNATGPAPRLYLEADARGCGVPAPGSNSRRTGVYVSVVSVVGLLLCALGLSGFLLARRKRALEAEFRGLELENLEYGPIKYTYLALRGATGGFDAAQGIGGGGGGGGTTFFRAVLGAGGRDVAVKRVVRGGDGWDRELAAEVRVIGRLRHRNLVQLQGWCHHKQDLLLVYESLAPHGSLDQVLFMSGGDAKAPPLAAAAKVLPWRQRVHVLKGVAAALVYLHEECEREAPLVHRNVKASNVMLDGEGNARLGDFGVAKVYDGGAEKVTEKWDVLSFGTLALQIVSGRPPPPADQSAALPPQDRSLVKWVRGLHQKKRILDAVDRRLELDFPGEEAAAVLHVGLLCSHPDPAQRPGMRHVRQMLSGEQAVLPVVPSSGPSASLFDLDGPARHSSSYCAPEISLIDSPEIGLIASFRDSMGERASSRDSMGKRSRSYGS